MRALRVEPINGIMVEEEGGGMIISGSGSMMEFCSMEDKSSRGR